MDYPSPWVGNGGLPHDQKYHRSIGINPRKRSTKWTTSRWRLASMWKNGHLLLQIPNAELQPTNTSALCRFKIAIMFLA